VLLELGDRREHHRRRLVGRAPLALAWRDAIVIYPDGTQRPGTGPGFAWQQRPGELEDQDLRFFDAMLAWLATNACIDERHVFVLGYSNGARFAYVVACERGDRIAAVAIVSGSMQCAPRGAIPVIVTHGVADTTIPYQRAADAIGVWTAKNACKSPPAPARTAGCVEASGCAAALTMCTHPGGHEYDASFTQTAVEFFKMIR
jgi:polyhydroxybutyrate depolymerase